MDPRQIVKWFVESGLKWLIAFLLGAYGLDLAKAINVPEVVEAIVVLLVAAVSIITSIKNRKTLLVAEPPK